MQYYADAAQCEYDVTNAVYRMHNELQQTKLQPRDIAAVTAISRVCWVELYKKISYRKQIARQHSCHRKFGQGIGYVDR